MPIAPVVNLTGIYSPLIETFVAEEKYEQSAKKMLDELEIWAKALFSLHTK